MTLLSVVWSQLITACSQDFCSQSFTAQMSQMLLSHFLEFNIAHPGCFITSSSLLNSELHHYVQYVMLLLFTFSWHFFCFELLHSKVVKSNADTNLRSQNRLFLAWDGSLMILVAPVYTSWCKCLQPSAVLSNPGNPLETLSVRSKGLLKQERCFGFWVYVFPQHCCRRSMSRLQTSKLSLLTL